VESRRQISLAEKQAVVARQGLRCFIDNHPVDTETDFEFDHIIPFAEGGKSEASNIGAVCKKHNREKGVLSLAEFRDRLDLRRFFEGAKKRRLDDLLTTRLGQRGFGAEVTSEIIDKRITLYLAEGPLETILTTDPATGEQYFYAVLPIEVLQNDSELQPRALEPERVWELYRHLRSHTQLAPTVCRLVGKQMLLFDGQHKAAAQVWAGRRTVDCKVYIDPDIRRLRETNLSAHDKLRQMPFYTSTLLEKYAAMASEDWQEFLGNPGPKTEVAFVEFIRAKANLSRAESVRRLRAMVVQDVLEHPQNALRDYIVEENRGRKNPLTMNRLNKTFFLEFIAAPPLNDEFETESYHRDEEKEHLVRLFNLVVTHGLEGRWSPERNDAAHQKADRLFSAGALRAWVPFLRDSIAPGLQLFDQEDRGRVFYRDLDDSDWAVIERFLTRLLSHKVWEDPDPALNDLRYDDAERAKGILRDAGLTPNWILGGS
jgi:hypothetical protein